MRAGMGPAAAAAAGIAAAVVCGLVNGVLVTQLNVIPFIVTLGTMLIVRGAAKGLAEERRIEAPVTWLNDLLRTERGTALLPAGIWGVLAAALIVAAVLRYTRFGRQVFAIGSNERMARLCGVAIPRTKIMVYTLSGLLTGFAGLLQFSKLSVGDPTVGVGAELDVIAAVIIGGGSLNGGRGSVVGTMMGAAIMTIIQIGCSQKGLANWVQQIVTGAIIVAAVALDRVRSAKGR
jgi:ribose/xylose/arabinose/galactoside ABC-type transport system permease subunit